MSKTLYYHWGGKNAALIRQAFEKVGVESSPVDNNCSNEGLVYFGVDGSAVYSTSDLGLLNIIKSVGEELVIETHTHYEPYEHVLVADAHDYWRPATYGYWNEKLITHIMDSGAEYDDAHVRKFDKDLAGSRVKQDEEAKTSDEEEESSWSYKKSEPSLPKGEKKDCSLRHKYSENNNYSKSNDPA